MRRGARVWALRRLALDRCGGLCSNRGGGGPGAPGASETGVAERRSGLYCPKGGLLQAKALTRRVVRRENEPLTDELGGSNEWV